MSQIISIGTAVPEYRTSQGVILEFMQAAYNNDTASRKLNILFHNSGINARNSVIPDFDNTQPVRELFENGSIPDVEKRLSVFKEKAVSLSVKAIEDALQKLNSTVNEFGFTHLITVTCTGIYAPGLGAALIGKLNLPRDINLTSINFMGCNAAFSALQIADMIAKTDQNARVLIVCVELCTLHFQPKNNNDNLLSNTIFGDGAAAVVVIPDAFPKQAFHKSLSISGFYSLLLDKGNNLMGWNITPVNFEMILDAGIPEFLGEEVNNIVLKAGKNLNISQSSIDNWAIHPGGKKILDTVKKQLKLSDSDLQHSYRVLADHGNMSSPTILFVLNEIIKADHNQGETIFALGFGPGLSIETALFTYA